MLFTNKTDEEWTQKTRIFDLIGIVSWRYFREWYKYAQKFEGCGDPHYPRVYSR